MSQGTFSDVAAHRVDFINAQRTKRVLIHFVDNVGLRQRAHLCNLRMRKLISACVVCKLQKCPFHHENTPI